MMLRAFVVLLVAGCGSRESGSPRPEDSPTESGTTDDSVVATDDSTQDSTDSDPTLPAPPILGSIFPTLGDTLGEVTLTLMGKNLEGGVVSIGDAACGSITFVDATTLTCVAPALAAGLHDVVLTTPGGEATLTEAYEAWSPELIPNARVYKANAGTTTGPLARTYLWDQATREAPWHPRDGAGLLWFRDRLWLLGGWYPPSVPEWGDQITTNEVWSSADLGRTWTLELAHDSDPPTSGPDARWTRRHTAGWLTHTHEGVPYLYVVGGDYDNITSDVWRSADGTTWELVTNSAPWGGRILHMTASYAGALYVMGGQMDLYDVSTAFDEVWRSEDGGDTWTRLDDAPWKPRGMTYNPTEHDGALWLCGGGTYDDEPRTYYNDVWRFDGKTWTEISPDGQAPWDGREYHNQFVYDGELWISSGYSPLGNHNDFWHSPDGVTWTAVESPPLAAGHADGIAVTPFGIVHASGNAMDTEVFQLTGYDAAPLSAWIDQGSSGADLSQTDVAERPELVVDAFGPGADGVWFDGDDFLTLEAPESQPAGRSVFWIGKTWKETSWVDNVNPSQTIVGTTGGDCRAQAGYSADQIELVVTDASGSWADGHVRRGSGQDDGQTRLVGFTHAIDGTVTSYIDGVVVDPPAATSYDAAVMAWNAIGCGYSTGSRPQAMLGFVVVVPAVLSEEEIGKLTELARKWGAG